MKIIKRYLTKNDCYNSGRTIKVTHMQLHSIGTPQPKAESLMSYWNQPGVGQMVHALVQYQPEEAVYEIMESNKRSWADAGYGNNHAYTVEMMEPDTIKYTSGANYKDLNTAKTKAHVLGTYKVAVQYFAKKCKEFGLNPLAKVDGVPVVFSHAEGNRLGVSSAHADPEHLWKAYGLTMDQFRKDVKAAMGGNRSKNEDGTYTVKKGDTLSTVAADFNISMKSIKAWNGLKSDTIKVSQKLKITNYIGEITSKAPVRKGAGKEYKKIDGYPILKKGNRVDVLGKKKSKAGQVWRKIRIESPKGTFYGWIWSKRIKKASL